MRLCMFSCADTISQNQRCENTERVRVCVRVCVFVCDVCSVCQCMCICSKEGAVHIAEGALPDAARLCRFLESISCVHT